MILPTYGLLWGSSLTMLGSSQYNLNGYLSKYNISQIKKIVAVREDHTGIEEKAKIESQNTIVAIDPDTKEQRILVRKSFTLIECLILMTFCYETQVTGADFYISPRVSQDGKKLVWVEWNHPNMV